MRVLVIGDHFVPASYYVDAYAEQVGEPVNLALVGWSGTKAEQHAAQQLMERGGPAAVAEPTEIVAAVGDAEVLAVHFAPVPAAVLHAAPDLRAVCVARAGLENVDLDAATAAGVGVVPVHGRNATAVAELAIGHMIAAGRDLARADRSVRGGGWGKDFGGPGDEVGGSTVGVVGFGHVGRSFARRLAGFEARLLVCDPHVDDAVIAEHGGQRADLDEVFRRCDFIQLMARHTPETDRFITAAHLALCKPTAYFVNTARSRLVDYPALYDALAAGRIAGAGIDVWDDEPLPADSPWRALENVTITTHFAGDTVTTNLRSARLVVDRIAELERTGRVAGAVNAGPLGWS